MSKIKINGVVRDMTTEEQTQYDADIANAQTRMQERQTAETAKATAQASGNTKLLDLGLSQAEATALTGYTPPVEEEE